MSAYRTQVLQKKKGNTDVSTNTQNGRVCKNVRNVLSKDLSDAIHACRAAEPRPEALLHVLGRVDPESVNAVLAHKLLDPRLVRADDLGELGVDVHEREGRVAQPAELGRGRVRVVDRAVGVVVVWVREQVVVLLEEVVRDVEICRVGIDGDVVDDYSDHKGDERRNAKMSASGIRVRTIDATRTDVDHDVHPALVDLRHEVLEVVGRPEPRVELRRIRYPVA